MKLIIIDDQFDENVLSLRTFLNKDYKVEVVTSFAEGKQRLEIEDFDIVFLDVNFPKENKNGLELLKWIKKNKSETHVVMISGLAGIDDAVKAVKLGAYDFLEKPFSLERVKIILDNLTERIKLLKTLEEVATNKINFITKNKIMKNILNEVKKYAKSSVNVVITGESGTGKDVIASLLHYLSPRKTGNFVKLNCSAIPKELFESELFGYEKGAFTGAIANKIGKLEAANNGTIFLDEIGDMPLEQQAKLLRVIENGEFYKLGSNKPVKVDTRIIAATNKNLEEEIKKGTFREDLYYRLNIINIYLPPLRDRKEDIPPLAKYFLDDIAFKEGLPQKDFEVDALQALQEYDFPGNVRELRNIVQRLYFATDKYIITKDDVKSIMSNLVNNVESSIKEKERESVFWTTMDYNIAKKELERIYILEQLKKHNYNVSQTAKNLNLIPNNLFRKIKQLGISIKKENN